MQGSIALVSRAIPQVTGKEAVDVAISHLFVLYRILLF